MTSPGVYVPGTKTKNLSLARNCEKAKKKKRKRKKKYGRSNASRFLLRAIKHPRRLWKVWCIELGRASHMQISWEREREEEGRKNEPVGSFSRFRRDDDGKQRQKSPPEETHDRAFPCTRGGTRPRERRTPVYPRLSTRYGRIRVGRSYRKSQIPLTSLASYQADGARLRYGFLYGPLGIYFFFTCDGYIFAIAATTGSHECARETRREPVLFPPLGRFNDHRFFPRWYLSPFLFLSFSLPFMPLIKCKRCVSSRTQKEKKNESVPIDRRSLRLFDK